MKKLLFRQLLLCFFIAAVMLAGGCGKGGNGNDDGTNPEYYISFKADGVQKKYTNQAIASLGHSDQDGLYNGVLQGYAATVGSDKAHVGIIIFSNSAVAAKIYQDPDKATNANGDEVPQVLINYIDEAGNGYITMGPTVDKNGKINSFPGSENVVADAKVTITKRTNTYLEGSFSGTAFLSTDATFKTKVVITEGKFILKAYSVE